MPVQILDDLEPLEVEQLADIVRILDVSSNFLQAINIRKISQDSIPQRAALRAPQLVEQLVDVLLPQVVTLARGKDAAGKSLVPAQGAGRSTGGSRAHGTPSGPPRSGSPPAQGGI